MNAKTSRPLVVATAAVLSASIASAAVVPVTNPDRPFGPDPFDPTFPGEGAGGSSGGNPGGGTPGGGPGPQFEYNDLLINGDFETGDLFGWNFNGFPAWQVSQGQIGGDPFGPGGTNYFANTLSSGGFDNGQSVTLDQIVLLPAGIDDELLVSFRAFSAFDSIDVRLEWLELTPGGFSVVDVEDFGTFGGIAAATNDEVMRTVVTPQNATHFRFAATGRLGDGNWIDAGLDDASVLAATPIPEPAIATLLAGGGLVLLRRR
ncbi:MAG: hypothetical protein AAGI46_03690 [Planctomycetota bacterium]